MTYVNPAHEPLDWRAATLDDAKTMSAVEKAVHTLSPERLEVFQEKIRLFGEGCRVLTGKDTILGYGIAYPWRINDVPPLDTFLGGILAEADCLFIHDVALLPNARGKGAARAFVDYAAIIARKRGLTRLALVSVYGTHPLWEKCGFVVKNIPFSSDKLTQYGETARYMASGIAFM